MDTFNKVTEVEHIGAAIRAKRKAMGVNQDELAGMSGVGVRFLSELERGKETCEIGKVLRVVQRLGLELWMAPRGSVAQGSGRVG